MEQLDKIMNCLQQKLTILEKISANNETQSRFIDKRKMKGLKRVLRERGQLLEELAAINKQLTDLQLSNSPRSMSLMIQEIQDKQEQILEHSKQILKQAIAERVSIGQELRESKFSRQVNHRYVNPWGSTVVRGRHFSAKG